MGHNRTLSSTTITDGILHIPQSSCVTGASPSDCLMSYQGHYCFLNSLSIHFHWRLYVYIYIYTYKVHMISFQTFSVWAFLLIVHKWNSSLLWSNLLRLQCTCCTVTTTSRRPHGSPLVWACQWPSSQPLSSPQLSHNDSRWA